MVNVYCWQCGKKINKDNILGLGHFDEDIGKYQGKAFVAFRCVECKKVRYQILDRNILSGQKKSLNRLQKSRANYRVVEQDSHIDINQVIEFHEILNEIETVDGFLKKCKNSGKLLNTEISRPITQPLDVYNLFMELNGDNKKRIMILTLNQDNYLLSWEFLGEGTGKKASFAPKTIFGTSFLIADDVSVIIAENLKDNFDNPSQKDILITKRLVKTGKIMGIDFLDHIVIGNNTFHSYDQLNLL